MVGSWGGGADTGPGDEAYGTGLEPLSWGGGGSEKTRRFKKQGSVTKLGGREAPKKGGTPPILSTRPCGSHPNQSAVPKAHRTPFSTSVSPRTGPGGHRVEPPSRILKATTNRRRRRRRRFTSKRVTANARVTAGVLERLPFPKAGLPEARGPAGCRLRRRPVSQGGWVPPLPVRGLWPSAPSLRPRLYGLGGVFNSAGG